MLVIRFTRVNTHKTLLIDLFFLSMPEERGATIKCITPTGMKPLGCTI